MKFIKIFFYLILGLQIFAFVSCNKKELAALGIKTCSPLVPTQDFLNSAKLITGGNGYYFEVSPLQDFRENYKAGNQGCSVTMLEVNVIKGSFKYIYDKEDQGVSLLSTWTQIDKAGDYQLSVSDFGTDTEISFCARSVSNLDEVSSWGCLPFSIDSALAPSLPTDSTEGGSVYSSSYCMSQDVNGQCGQYQDYNVTNINSSLSFNGVSLNQVQLENPCILSGGGYYGQTSFNRQVVTTRVNIGTVVTSGDMYVGVTSFGDVAAIIGDGTPTPTFVAYLCPRPISGQGTLAPQITIGAYTNCSVKYITAANIYFPDSTQANFRAPSPGGSSDKRKFTFCQQ